MVALGEVAERPIAGALKAPEGQPSGGSNPSLAAKRRLRIWEEPKATAPSLAAKRRLRIWEEPKATAPSLAAKRRPRIWEEPKATAPSLAA